MIVEVYTQTVSVRLIGPLTGIGSLLVVIVEFIVTTVYKREVCSGHMESLIPDTTLAVAGFRISVVTDSIQGAIVVGLIFLSVIAAWVENKVEQSLVLSSDFFNPSLLGWQLVCILPVAVPTNNPFTSDF